MQLKAQGNPKWTLGKKISEICLMLPFCPPLYNLLSVCFSVSCSLSVSATEWEQLGPPGPERWSVEDSLLRGLEQLAGGLRLQTARILQVLTVAQISYFLSSVCMVHGYGVTLWEICVHVHLLFHIFVLICFFSCTVQTFMTALKQWLCSKVIYQQCVLAHI